MSDVCVGRHINTHTLSPVSGAAGGAAGLEDSWGGLERGTSASPERQTLSSSSD